MVKNSEKKAVTRALTLLPVSLSDTAGDPDKGRHEETGKCHLVFFFFSSFSKQVWSGHYEPAQHPELEAKPSLPFLPLACITTGCTQAPVCEHPMARRGSLLRVW